MKKEFKFNFVNHLRHLAGSIINLFIVIGLYYYYVIDKDSNNLFLLVVLVIFFLNSFFPGLILYYQYSLIDRGRKVVVDFSSDKIFIRNLISMSNDEIPFSSIEEIEVNRMRKGALGYTTIASDFRYYKLILKNSQEYIITSLLIPSMRWEDICSVVIVVNRYIPFLTDKERSFHI